MKHTANKRPIQRSASVQVLEPEHMKAIWGGYPNAASNYELAEFLGNMPGLTSEMEKPTKK